VFPPASMTITLYNISVMLSRLPRWVREENGLDVMALFPAHRRWLALLKLMLFLKLHPDKLRQTLDVVRERFDVRLGPLNHAPAVRERPARGGFLGKGLALAQRWRAIGSASGASASDKPASLTTEGIS